MHEVSKVSVFDEFRRVRFCSQGLDRISSGNRVPGIRGIKKVPGFGDSVAKVPKVALYFESMLLHFETILLYFSGILLYFESMLFCFESKNLYFESMLLYFATMLASGCTESQYSKGKEKVVINVHFINANLRAVGDNTYAYFGLFKVRVSLCQDLVKHLVKRRRVFSAPERRQRVEIRLCSFGSLDVLI